MDFEKKTKNTIKVERLDIFEKNINITYSLNSKHFFQTNIYYPNGDLEKIKSLYSEDDLNKIYSNIALFEGMKFMVIFPDYFDITNIQSGINIHAINYFNYAIKLLYSQHLYENNNTTWKRPEFIYSKLSEFSQENKVKINIEKINGEKDRKKRPFLVSNGGGKDSHLAMRLMEEAGFDFDVFTQARSEYGRADIQLREQEKNLKHLRNGTLKSTNKLIINDDFTDGTFVQNYFPEITGECTLGFPCQVGFPEMIFESLVFVLAKGYNYFITGNERSANASQVKGLEKEDTVNHQYLKSYDSEKNLNNYIFNYLLEDFEVFSILRPIHDYRIYRLISQYPEIIPDVHSCNIVKPWCKDCSKCAYVFLNLIAVFDADKILENFNENLFEKESLMIYWNQLMGLGEHNAFECVGEVDETRAAFKLCVDKGLKGKAIDLFKNSGLIEKCDFAEIDKKYGKVYEEDLLIPDFVFQKIKPLMERRNENK